MSPLSLLSYTGTENLGDAVQTIALRRLLCDTDFRFTYRDRDTGAGADSIETHLLNGYLDGRWTPAPAARTCFAGVYVADTSIAERVASLANGGVVGARDPHSLELVSGAGARAMLLGCATLTLPRYAGPRSGVIHVDDGHQDELTQWLPKEVSWGAQWWRATERLLLLERAELVYTTRLHVALPCLAFGTPVQMPADTLDRVHEPGRLSLLETLGFRFGEPQVIDVAKVAAEFRGFVLKCPLMG